MVGSDRDNNRAGDSSKIKEEKIYGKASSLSLFYSRPDDIIRAFVRRGEEGTFKEILSELAKRRILYRLVTQEELFKITESEHHEGICLVSRARNFDSLPKFFKALDREKPEMPVLFLDGISNPHNIGGILRSAAFFGVRFILLRSAGRIQLAGSLSRVSEGALEHLIISRVSDLDRIAEEFKQRDYSFIVSDVAEPEGKKSETEESNSRHKSVFVLGNERTGVSKEVRGLASSFLHIAGTGVLDSLNVSVAAGVFLDRFFQMKQ